MANYCGECILWIGSQDVNKYGERWCPHSRRYESSNQNTYGCKGFIYSGRAILTQVCQMLHLPTEEFFAYFDEVKQNYLVPNCMTQLIEYCEYGPQLAQQLKESNTGMATAHLLLDRYILPAKAACLQKSYKHAVNIYAEMVSYLQNLYSMPTLV